MIQYNTLLKYMFPSGAEYHFTTAQQTTTRTNVEGAKSIVTKEVRDYTNYYAIEWIDESLPKPSLEDCLAAWLTMQFEIEDREILTDRRNAYDLGLQMEALYNAMVAGTFPIVQAIIDHNEDVKMKHPKRV